MAHERSPRDRRRYRIDQAARCLIALGGWSVILSILLIFVFLFKETLPLWSGADVRPVERWTDSPTLRTGAFPLLSDDPDLRTETFDGGIALFDGIGEFRILDGSSGKERTRLPLPEPLPGPVTIAAGAPSGWFALGTATGVVVWGRLRWAPSAERSTTSNSLRLDSLQSWTVWENEPIALLAFQPAPAGPTVAAVGKRPNRIRLLAERETGFLFAEKQRITHDLTLPEDEKITALTLDSAGAQLFAGTQTGRIYGWRLDEEATPTPVDLTALEPLSAPITAMAFLLGDITLLVGDRSGRVSTYFEALHPDGSRRFVHVRDFRVHRAPIVQIRSSSRKKMFLTLDASDALAVHHFTSGRTVARLNLDPATSSPRLALSARSDWAAVWNGDQIHLITVRAPHVEASWKTLFCKVWYENRAGPEYVWQSSGASAASEPKLSLIPLIFGTLKGTFYSLLFAAPIAVLAALYTALFMGARMRRLVKPLVELMAALPSVVVGLLAGLWLAPLLETRMVGILMFPLLGALIMGLAGLVVYLLPRRAQRRLRTGFEFYGALPLTILGLSLSLAVGAALERGLFGGDFGLWVTQHLGLAYSQRNAVVVGIAMGFAVIPLIFTISEDALARVPASLRTASLALGATEWQTAWRVMLPAAAPGIFSAITIGFGRAIGETMIMLMATGNTPLMDWNPFNGMRTLSANIAVELPEAPVGGTLYRVLFLTATLLFLGTFLVNTAAELIRHRLRERFGNW